MVSEMSSDTKTSGKINCNKSEEEQSPLFKLFKELKNFKPKRMVRDDKSDQFEQDELLQNEEGSLLKIHCTLQLL